MRASFLFAAIMGGMLALGCGVSAPVSNTQTQQSQPQRKPSSQPGVYSFKADFAFTQPEVDASKYAPASALLQQMEQNPSVLSKNEYYAASSAYEPGSASFNKVYETAVKFYPNDEMVNLNRANALMQADNVLGAKDYVDKAGDGPAAIYTRGVWYALRGNFQQAITYFKKADEMGYPKAAAALRALVGSK